MSSHNIAPASDSAASETNEFDSVKLTRAHSSAGERSLHTGEAVGSIPTAPTIDRLPAVIVDIDGTLSDASHRQHLVQGKKKNFTAFYDGCYLDALHGHVGVVVNLLAAQYKILLVSGRVERVRQKTVDWLDKHWICYECLMLRPDGDTRPDDVLKEEILDRDILPHYAPVMALDDRNRVVAMWRRRGIPCLQVAEGDF